MKFQQQFVSSGRSLEFRCLGRMMWPQGIRCVGRWSGPSHVAIIKKKRFDSSTSRRNNFGVRFEVAEPIRSIFRTKRAPLLSRHSSRPNLSRVSSHRDFALETAFASLNESSFVLPSVYTPTPRESGTRASSYANLAGILTQRDDDFDDDESVVDQGQWVEPEQRKDLWLILGAMWVGSFLSALDGTVVATCLGIIGSEFSVSNSIGWLGTSYLLTQTAAQPLYGKCADIFGRRSVTLFSSTIFLIGSLACGLAQSYPQLLAARAFAGVGGAGLAVMMSIVISDLVPLRRRGTFQGFSNLVYSAGASLGGPLGGLLGDTIGWRWAFLIQVPICAIHTMMVLWKVENSFASNYEPVDIRAKIKRVDFLGSLLLVTGVGSLLTGLSVGGNSKPWNAPFVIGTLLGGVAFLVIFVLFETFGAKEPLLAPHLLFTRTPGFASLTNWFAAMAQFAMLYSVPLWFNAVKGLGNSEAGAHLIPNVVATSIASLSTGLIMSKTGRYRLMLAICAGLAVLSPLSMILWDRTATPGYAFWLSMFPGGFGYGGILTITLVALISAVPPDSMAAATGGSYLFRATGSVLGISLSTAILQNALQFHLPRVLKGPDAADLIARLRMDIGVIQTLPDDLKDVVIGAYQISMRNVFAATTLMALGAFIMCLGIGHHDLPSRLDRK
ncbi:hypothetical protein T439DRAFT_181881 [Meredithblackwellia eburnea MCA 4105]